MLLAASGSSKGASRWIVDNATQHGWKLISTRYCFEETSKNLPKLGNTAVTDFQKAIRLQVEWLHDTWASQYPLVYSKSKDRPVVIAALASEVDYLLTLDRQDFHGLLGHQCYGISIRTPGDFLIEMRSLGRL